MSESLRTEPMQEGDQNSGFKSGEKALDRYFTKHALENDRIGIGKTFVLRGLTQNDPQVLGFYTLSMASVKSEKMEEAVQEKLPRYPLPVVLIGRLAVHNEAQGRGFGEFLLVEALNKALQSSETVGSIGVIVDAKNQNAAEFYKKYGFTPLSEDSWPRRMFISFKTIRESIEA